MLIWIGAIWVICNFCVFQDKHFCVHLVHVFSFILIDFFVRQRNIHHRDNKFILLYCIILYCLAQLYTLQIQWLSLHLRGKVGEKFLEINNCVCKMYHTQLMHSRQSSSSCRQFLMLKAHNIFTFNFDILYKLNFHN